MSDIALRNATVVKLTGSFHELRTKPSFNISDDTDTHIFFSKRRDKYYGIRTGSKADFESPEQFLIYSCLVEKIRARVKNNITLEQLTAEQCSVAELRDIFSKARTIKKHLPDIADVERCYTIANSSDINWIFLADESNYHSVFWNESESKLFSRCA